MKVIVGKYNLEIEDVVSIEHDESGKKVILHIKDGTTRQVDCANRSVSFDVLV